ERRDDLTVELCALYNQTGQPEKALKRIASRQFQPREGGEGQALGQHVRTHLQLGRKALEQNEAGKAVEHFESALTAPENLSEAKHLLANQSDIHFWLGLARHAAGDTEGATEAWKLAGEFKGDFQDMSVRVFSEMTLYSALSLHRLGETGRAESLLRELLAYATDLENEVAKIDYFATSLPTMLLFEEDIQERQVTTARFMQAQAQMGLGHIEEANQLLDDVLARDPNHPLVIDLQAIKTCLS
ncbi:MAG: tetratricopeptide repeat protein, partial [Puniceicoccaceae bacterium]